MQIPVTQQPLTPPTSNGFYDIPFVYSRNTVYPKAGPGSNPGIDINGFYAAAWQDIVPSQGDYEFHLRRWVNGWPRSFNLYDAANHQLYSPYDFCPDTATAALAFRGDELVIPEFIYPPGAGIRYYNSNGVQFVSLDSYWYKEYDFQGIKRIFKAPNRVPNYPYRERPFIYPLTFSLAAAYPWTARFIVLILNYDWEFQGLYYTAGYGNVPTVSSGTIGFQLKLYDPGQYAMMSDYVDVETLTISNKIGIAGCFPTPPVVYPRGSQLIVDVQSLALAADVPATVELNFVGVNRVPC